MVITKMGGGEAPPPVPPLTIEFTGTSESQNDFGIVMHTLREIAIHCDFLSELNIHIDPNSPFLH